MGVQSQDIRGLNTIQLEAKEYLKKTAENEFYYKYFLTENCFKSEEDTLKYHYVVSKYLTEDKCSIVDYINKKMSGELDYEYRKRKILQRLDRVEFTWECDDMYDNTECCDWKAIQW